MKKSELHITHARYCLLNRIVNYVCSSPFGVLARGMVKIVLHIEMTPQQARMAPRLPHPYNIIINPSVVLGKNVTIYQCVTLGSKQFGSNRGVPEVRDDVVIYPNSVIVGNIVIGRESIVGASTVITGGILIPPKSLIVGNPGRQIGTIED